MHVLCDERVIDAKDSYLSSAQEFAQSCVGKLSSNYLIYPEGVSVTGR